MAAAAVVVNMSSDGFGPEENASSSPPSGSVTLFSDRLVMSMLSSSSSDLPAKLKSASAKSFRDKIYPMTLTIISGIIIIITIIVISCWQLGNCWLVDVVVMDDSIYCNYG